MWEHKICNPWQLVYKKTGLNITLGSVFKAAELIDYIWGWSNKIRNSNISTEWKLLHSCILYDNMVHIFCSFFIVSLMLLVVKILPEILWDRDDCNFKSNYWQHHLAWWSSSLGLIEIKIQGKMVNSPWYFTEILGHLGIRENVNQETALHKIVHGFHIHSFLGCFWSCWNTLECYTFFPLSLPHNKFCSYVHHSF